MSLQFACSNKNIRKVVICSCGFAQDTIAQLNGQTHSFQETVKKLEAEKEQQANEYLDTVQRFTSEAAGVQDRLDHVNVDLAREEKRFVSCCSGSSSHKF